VCFLYIEKNELVTFVNCYEIVEVIPFVSNVKEYLGASPYICGLLGILGVLSPAAFFGYFVYIWNWGLTNYSMLGMFNYSRFISDNPFVLIQGIVVSALIVIISIAFIVSGYRYKHYNTDRYKMGRLWSVGGSVILVGAIFSYIILGSYTWGGELPEGMWAFYTPGFGIIGPVIGSVISIYSGVYLIRFEKQNRIVWPSEILTPDQKSSCPHCAIYLSKHARFCHKCGRDMN
jgi:hypothetical protein